jgi:hypothetical protein
MGIFDLDNLLVVVAPCFVSVAIAITRDIFAAGIGILFGLLLGSFLSSRVAVLS